MALGLPYFQHQNCQILMTFWPVNSRQLKKLPRLLQRIQSVTLKLNLALSYVFCNYSMLVTLCKVGEVNFKFAFLAQLGFMKRQRMKDLLLRDRVVVRTSNMKVSRRHLADSVKNLHQKACRTCSRIIFPHSAN